MVGLKAVGVVVLVRRSRTLRGPSPNRARTPSCARCAWAPLAAPGDPSVAAVDRARAPGRAGAGPRAWIVTRAVGVRLGQTPRPTRVSTARMPLMRAVRAWRVLLPMTTRTARAPPKGGDASARAGVFG